LPAVGLIKKIDFFVDDVPYDLKVTYLPEGYVSDYRKINNLGNELTLMKSSSRKLGLPVKDSSGSDLKAAALWQQLEDHPSKDAKNLLGDFRSVRSRILNEAMLNPSVLAKWLYENQGERRFDSSNRLFIVLVDSDRYFDSWRLKRAKSLIKESVIKFFIGDVGSSGFEMNFEWDGETYAVMTDIIFVVK
jgi:tryptophan 2,3-dioxygenase